MISIHLFGCHFVSIVRLIEIFCLFYLSVYIVLSVYSFFSVNLSGHLSVCLCNCLYVCLSVCLFICLSNQYDWLNVSVCLSIYIYFFIYLNLILSIYIISIFFPIFLSTHTIKHIQLSDLKVTETVLLNYVLQL